MKKLLIALGLSISILACTPTTEAPPKQGMEISSAVVRTPMGGQTMTAGYFQLANHTDLDDALIAVESPVASRVEIHATELIDGRMSMRKKVSLDIKAGETVEFKPKGHHLMLFDVTLGTDQKDAALTLKFKHAPDVTIIADIVDTVGHATHH